MASQMVLRSIQTQMTETPVALKVWEPAIMLLGNSFIYSGVP